MSEERIVPAGPFGMTPQQAADELHDAHVELLMLRRDITELRAALNEALDMNEEGWSYASAFFRDKHMDFDRISELRAIAAGQPTPSPPANLTSRGK